jgi:hypothetical protein
MEKNLFSEENLPILKALSKNLPNDIELGREIRKSFRTNSFVIKLGNDQELGKEIRKQLLKIK